MASIHETIFSETAVPQLNQYFGVSVYLTRGPLRTAAITARRGSYDHEAMGHDFGVDIKVRMRAFVLSIADVVIDGDAIEPRTGDRIVEGADVFEISPPGKDRSAVELVEGGYEWIAHTKQVK